MGRLEQFGPAEKILKNQPVDPFKVLIIKAEYAKKVFLEGISQLGITV